MCISINLYTYLQLYVMLQAPELPLPPVAAGAEREDPTGAAARQISPPGPNCESLFFRPATYKIYIYIYTCICIYMCMYIHIYICM